MPTNHQFKIVNGCSIYTPRENTSQKCIDRIKLIQYSDGEIIPSLHYIDSINVEFNGEFEELQFERFEKFYKDNLDLFSDDEFPLYKKCKNCDEIFLPKSKDREFCYRGKKGGACRVAFFRGKNK